MDDLGGFLERLTVSLSAHPTLLDSLTAVLGAFVFGQILAWAYERTYHGLSYSNNVTHTLILSAVSAALIILAMKHSLVAGLGLLAALSMIRFRTTLKAPKDLVYVMAAMTLGIACGANALVPAAVGCVGFTLISFYLAAGPIGSRSQFDGVLRFRTAAGVTLEPALSQLLREHCRRFILLNVGETAQGDALEHAYQIQFRRDRDRDALLVELRERLSAREARLLLQEAATEY